MTFLITSKTCIGININLSPVQATKNRCFIELYRTVPNQIFEIRVLSCIIRKTKSSSYTE